MKTELELIKKIEEANFTDAEKRELIDLINQGKQGRTSLIKKIIFRVYGLKKLSELLDIDIGNLE
jgi:hypothetical protein